MPPLTLPRSSLAFATFPAMRAPALVLLALLGCAAAGPAPSAPAPPDPRARTWVERPSWVDSGVLLRREDGGWAAYASGSIELGDPPMCATAELMFQAARGRGLSELSHYREEAYVVRERSERSGQRAVDLRVQRRGSEAVIRGAQPWSAWLDRESHRLHVLMRAPWSEEVGPALPPDPVDPRAGQTLAAAHTAFMSICVRPAPITPPVLSSSVSAAPIVRSHFEIVARTVGPALSGLARAGDEVWALGTHDLLRFSGGRFSKMELPEPGVWSALAVFDPTHLWIAGERGRIFFWDGRRWTRQLTPTKDSLYALGGLGAKDLWAVGDRGTALHFDGKTWVSRPTGGRATLYRVAQRPGTRVWAFGEGESVWMFDGARWDDTLDGLGRDASLAFAALGGSPLAPAAWHIERDGTIVGPVGPIDIRVPWIVRAVVGDARRVWFVGDGGAVYAEAR